MTDKASRRPAITVSTDDLDRLEGLLGGLRSGALLGLSVGQRIDWPVPGGRTAHIRILDVVSQPGRRG